MHKWLLVAVVLVAGCKKDTGSTVSAPAPGAPTSTKDQDALWALAPVGVKLGVVASPRGVASLESALIAVKKLFAAAPDLAAANTKMEQALTEALGTSNVTLSDLGLSHDKGIAFFLAEHGAISVLPVADRDTFLAKVKGTKGTDTDTIKGAACKTVQGYYVCAKPPAMIEAVGKGKLVDKLGPAGARGDIELVSAFEPGVALVAQLDKGAMVVRGTVTGVPPEIASKLGAPVKPRDDGSAGFITMNVKPLLEGIPPQPLVAGVTAADLARTVDGPVSVTINSGGIGMDVRVPLSNPTPAQTVIEHCTEIAGLAMIGAKLDNGACHVPIPQYGLELDAWVAGNELRIGKRGAHGPAPIPLPPIGAEIAAGEWSFALFGHGSVFAAPKLPQPFQELPEEAKAAVRALAMMNELGIAARIDNGAVKFIVSMRTAWSNPDDVVAKLVAITPQQILDGKGAELAKPIADGAPNSPFAGDLKAGMGGMMALAAPVGILAAVAIPAFMDYMKKSKVTEAALQLNKLSKRLKVAQVENGAYPKGDVPPTPAASCCTGPNFKCESTAKDWANPVWKALDFEITEPQLYRYGYHSDGKTFTAIAVGDLDCDGIEATYTLEGDASGAVRLQEPPRGAD